MARLEEKLEEAIGESTAWAIGKARTRTSPQERGVSDGACLSLHDKMYMLYVAEMVRYGCPRLLEPRVRISLMPDIALYS